MTFWVWNDELQPKRHHWTRINALYQKKKIKPPQTITTKNNNSEWDCVICSDVDGPRDCHTEWNKSEREKKLYINTYVKSREMV